MLKYDDNYIGRKFNRLTITKILGHGYCEAKCDCGNIRTYQTGYIVNGHTKSCGCYEDEIKRSKYKDLSGMKFNHLTVMYKTDLRSNRQVVWHCKCDCGNETNVSSGHLQSGHTKSCGCVLTTEEGFSDSRLYRVYMGIKTRCNNSNDHTYKYYGGVGITICDSWMESFLNFKNDMYESYLEHVDKYGEDNTTVDRIDVSGNYCKENCKWATKLEQANNRRTTTYVYYGNNKYALGELCRILNKKYYMVYRRIKLGWNIYQALFTQKGEKRK